MKDFWKYFDKLTFAVLFLLSLIGIVMIYSASHTTDSSLWLKQLLWFVISIVIFFLMFKFKIETIFRFRFHLLVILIISLIFLLGFGMVISRTRSWLKIGFISIQFSEFIKIPLALIMAKMLCKIDIVDIKSFGKFILLLGIPFVLIAGQPDFGTAFILVSLVLMAMLLKGIRPMMGFLFLIICIVGSLLVWNYILKPYQKGRIISFLSPEKYSKSSGYQIIQSKIAIGSGGLKGKGYLKGSQSQFKFLPTRHTDFIVSVLGEEFGFLGMSVLLLLFFTLFYRQFNIRTQSDEEFYFVYLFNGMILFQFLINVLMTIGLFPIMGIPLPFVSYGGSSLLSFYVGEAIIFKIKINNFLNES